MFNLVEPIEYAAQFNGFAYIVFSADEFPHLVSEKEESIIIRFKTTAKNGVYFFFVLKFQLIYK